MPKQLWALSRREGQAVRPGGARRQGVGWRGALPGRRISTLRHRSGLALWAPSAGKGGNGPRTLNSQTLNSRLHCLLPQGS